MRSTRRRQFTPDGGSLLFTSDRGGSPQIYRLNLANNSVERLTFEGSYNVSPRPYPDGKGFVYVRRDGGRFQIASQDFATRQIAGADRGSRRRIALDRAQRPHDPVRERVGRAWYSGRRFERWPRQATPGGGCRRCP